MSSKKNYEFFDIFKKSCSYTNGVGNCSKTRESKRCINGKCLNILVPESKTQVLKDYYKQIQTGGTYDNRYKCLQCKKKYSTKNNLYKHKLSHNDYFFRCPSKNCKYKTLKFGDLQEHILKNKHLKRLQFSPDNYNDLFNIQKQFGGERKKKSIALKNGKISKGQIIPIKEQEVMGTLIENIRQKYKCPICNDNMFDMSVVEHIKLGHHDILKRIDTYKKTYDLDIKVVMDELATLKMKLNELTDKYDKSKINDINRSKLSEEVGNTLNSCARTNKHLQKLMIKRQERIMELDRQMLKVRKRAGEELWKIIELVQIK